MDRSGPIIPIVAGFVIIVFAFYGLSTITLWTSTGMILFFIGVKSFGQSCLNAPLNTVALGSLPEGKVRMGSGIVGMTRGLGEAFGIAVLSFLLERHIFFNVQAMTPLQEPSLSGVERYSVLAGIKALLLRTGEYGVTLDSKAEALLGHSLLGEAMTWAYQGLFRSLAVIYIILIG